MVVVAGHQEAAGLAEGHGGDAADDVVVVVHGELLVASNVEEPTTSVVGPACQRVTVREKLK